MSKPVQPVIRSAAAIAFDKDVNHLRNTAGVGEWDALLHEEEVGELAKLAAQLASPAAA